MKIIKSVLIFLLNFFIFSLPLLFLFFYNLNLVECEKVHEIDICNLMLETLNSRFFILFFLSLFISASAFLSSYLKKNLSNYFSLIYSILLLLFFSFILNFGVNELNLVGISNFEKITILIDLKIIFYLLFFSILMDIIRKFLVLFFLNFK